MIRHKISNVAAVMLAISVLTGFGAARADRIDYLRNGEPDHVFGEIISLGNNYIDFREGCNGPVKRMRWKLFIMNVVFTRTCQPSEVAMIGGEPSECAGTEGRWFRMMTSGREANVDFVKFDGDELTVGIQGSTWREKSPKESEIYITLMCDGGTGYSIR